MSSHPRFSDVLLGKTVPGLPRPTEWKNKACDGVDTDRFFPEDNTKYSKALRKELDDMCFSCPVIKLCKAWAVYNKEVGYWAGTTDKERQRFMKIFDNNAQSVLEILTQS